MYYVYRDADRKTEVIQKKERGNVAQTQKYHRRRTKCNLREDFPECGRNKWLWHELGAEKRSCNLQVGVVTGLKEICPTKLLFLPGISVKLNS